MDHNKKWSMISNDRYGRYGRMDDSSGSDHGRHAVGIGFCFGIRVADWFMRKRGSENQRVKPVDNFTGVGLVKDTATWKNTVIEQYNGFLHHLHPCDSLPWRWVGFLSPLEAVKPRCISLQNSWGTNLAQPFGSQLWEKTMTQKSQKQTRSRCCQYVITGTSLDH